MHACGCPHQGCGRSRADRRSPDDFPLQPYDIGVDILILNWLEEAVAVYLPRVIQTADHNIGDKLDRFERKVHTLRQEVITSELTDIVTGSEAILGKGGS